MHWLQGKIDPFHAILDCYLGHSASLCTPVKGANLVCALAQHSMPGSQVDLAGLLQTLLQRKVSSIQRKMLHSDEVNAASQSQCRGQGVLGYVILDAAGAVLQTSFEV